MMPDNRFRVWTWVARTLRDIRRDGLRAVRRKLRRLPGAVLKTRFVDSLRLTIVLIALWREVIATRNGRTRGLARERMVLLRQRLKEQRTSPVIRLVARVYGHLAGGDLESARRVVDSAESSLRSSPEVLHVSAQIAYLRGEWSESIARRVDETLRLDDQAAESWLSNLGVRFISGEFIGHIGHLGLIDLIQRARYLGVLSPERRVFVGRTDSVANIAYLECWRPHMEIHYLQMNEFRAFEELMRPLFEDVSIVRLKNSRIDLYRAYAMVNTRWREESRSALISPDPESIERARSVFERHGLERGRWFVGLHVREGDPFPWTNAVDSKMSTYVPAIQSILAAGGAVIRLGSSNMWRLPEIPGVIDYSAADWKSPELDVFVWSQCRFFVGTGSGPVQIAPTFGRPMLLSNFPSHALDQDFSEHLMLPKRVIRGDGSGVPFREVLRSPFGYGISRSHEGYDWRIEDNTPEELEAAVNEMIELTSGVGRFDRLVRTQERILDELHALGRTGRTAFPASFVSRHPSLFDG
jgi:putative glycosyltransferase (TIGR04372 family)